MVQKLPPIYWKSACQRIRQSLKTATDRAPRDSIKRLDLKNQIKAEAKERLQQRINS